MGVVLIILIPNQHISILQFIVFTEQQITEKLVRGTTCVTPSSGGGTSNDMPWRDRDEDFLHFAHRVMLYAHAQYYPVNRHKRTQNSSYSFSYVYRIMGGNISSGLCHSLLLLGILFFTELAIH